MWSCRGCQPQTPLKQSSRALHTVAQGPQPVPVNKVLLAHSRAVHLQAVHLLWQICAKAAEVHNGMETTCCQRRRCYHLSCFRSSEPACGEEGASKHLRQLLGPKPKQQQDRGPLTRSSIYSIFSPFLNFLPYCNWQQLQ